jgi:hypothetical protein
MRKRSEYPIWPAAPVTATLIGVFIIGRIKAGERWGGKVKISPRANPVKLFARSEGLS